MPTRREFLRTAALVSLTPTVPASLARAARAAGPDPDGRCLVVIQLDGGNDGLNTVVPYADEGYARHRKELRLPADRLIRLDDHVGLHPDFRPAADLLEQGRLAIVQGVGYPNPNRSHASSMAVWHTARSDGGSGHGWIGRALDDTASPDGPPEGGTGAAVLLGDESPPAALRGRRSSALSLRRPDELRLSRPVPAPAAGGTARHRGTAPGGGADSAAADFVRRTTLDAYAASGRLAGLDRPDRGSYPATELGSRLALAAGMIKAGFGARVYYAIQPGYDTHYLQLPAHARLLADLGGSLEAFFDDLASAGLSERVIALCFSEFGRRVQENASLGTDHGTAGPIFLAGPAVAAGLHGRSPSLTELEDGDLRWGIDFRRVYATALEGWLGIPPAGALGGAFEPLTLLRV